ncbi:hypothetical protein WJX79_007401 [Trebouxia sp. C0005]
MMRFSPVAAQSILRRACGAPDQQLWQNHSVAVISKLYVAGTSARAGHLQGGTTLTACPSNARPNVGCTPSICGFEAEFRPAAARD